MLIGGMQGSVSTGPKISKSESQLAPCRKQRLQNSCPLLATSLVSRHPNGHISGQTGPGGAPSSPVAQTPHVVTKVPTIQIVSAPVALHTGTEHSGGGDSKKVHTPEAGKSTAIKPKSLMTHVKPSSQGAGGIRPPMKQLSPSGRGDGVGKPPGRLWAKPDAKKSEAANSEIERMSKVVSTFFQFFFTT
ncbi:hypothetical protein FGB62_98g035 [Gracilaria domingensis]|nr:hypothetical protein FGB62_98g035 [Gracilaria domingensis]